MITCGYSMYDTGSSLLVALTRYRREHTNTQKQEKPTQREKPPSGSHNPKAVVPQTNYHTLITMGFQISTPPRLPIYSLTRPPVCWLPYSLIRLLTHFLLRPLTPSVVLACSLLCSPAHLFACSFPHWLV